MPDCGSGSFWFESRYLPFLWKVKYQSFNNLRLLKIKSITFFLNLLRPTQNALMTKFNVFLKLFLLKESTNAGLYNLKQVNYSTRFIYYDEPNKKLKKTKFTVQDYGKNSLIIKFLNVNLWSPATTLEIHPSFASTYFYNSQSNLGVFNLKKVFNVWFNVLSFLNNLLTHKLHYLFFSSSYFKYENLAINWRVNNKLRSIWRYSNPFIFFMKNKTTRYNDIFFKRLSRKTSKLAIVVDIYYHKRTLHYFNRYKFFTIGPVPVTSSLYSLSLAFPVSSNSVFSNLFFIRMLFRLKKLTATYHYKRLSKYTITNSITVI